MNPYNTTYTHHLHHCYQCHRHTQKSVHGTISHQQKKYKESRRLRVKDEKMYSLRLSAGLCLCKLSIFSCSSGSGNRSKCFRREKTFVFMCTYWKARKRRIKGRKRKVKKCTKANILCRVQRMELTVSCWIKSFYYLSIILFFNNIIYGLHSMIDSLILCSDGKLLSLLRPSRVPLFTFIYIIVLRPSKFLNECCSENFKSTICPVFWFPRSQVGLPAGCFHLIFIHGNKQWTKTPC